tara:strand:+ start:454 stop:1620 length:1167 start_codon:yes stop_codon:yes gene_type:complete
MKNILLIGINGVYNFGCEAIIRGSVEILKSLDENIKISYASYNYDYDKKKLSDCPVHVIDRSNSRKKITIRRIIKKILSFVNIDIALPYDDIKFIKKYNFDTVFSIGGDMFTISSNGGFGKSLPLFLEKCQQKGLRYIHFGCSIGPFESNKEALTFFKSHLSKVDLIVAREMKTINYLNKIGVTKNVKLAPDPAFFVESELIKHENNSNKTKTIAINLSPLSSLHFYNTIQESINKMVNAIIDLLKKSEFNLLLVPHVFSKIDSDNDILYLMQIFEALPNDLKKRVAIIQDDLGFIGTKRELLNCDYVIASRMHCAVNAANSKIPTIFISYSEKAKGMVEMVYENSKNIIKLEDFENADKILDLIKHNNFNSNIEEMQKFDFSFLKCI